MKILLLGGTAEARGLAGRLQQAGVHFIYSLAGVTDPVSQPFLVRRGGFGGVDGLSAWLRREHISLLVDVTHPYAAGISANAMAASRRVGLPLWSWQRPAWQPRDGDRWQSVDDWPAAAQRLSGYHRPLLTLGRTPLKQPRPVPEQAFWLLRCMPGRHEPLPPRTGLIMDPGPFSVGRERALLLEHGIDVLVSRNSGGSAVAAKIEASRELGLPVLMLARPEPLPEHLPAGRRFSDIDSLFSSMIEWIQH